MIADEVAELRQRLAEAEETIMAIRQGEVDALVVGDGERPFIFDIGGDAQSYRTFMEAMHVGAAALDQNGRILYINEALARTMRRELVDIQGKTFSEFARPHVAALIEGLIQSGSTAPSALDIREDDDTVRSYIVSVRPLDLGTSRAYALTVTDVTERAQAEALARSERAARAVIASANEAVFVCDVNGVVTHANATAALIAHEEPVGRRFSDTMTLQFADATGLVQGEDVVLAAARGHAVQGIEVRVPDGKRAKDFLLSAAPLQIGEDTISGAVITMVDLTQRKAAEARQLLLMRELDHRVKNTLALVLSIAGRTKYHEETLEGFHRSFTARIQALAATHNLLAANSWSDLTLEDVVTNELEPFLGGHFERVSVRDLSVAANPRAAIAFGLVIHELATNAAKYGALSNGDGRVTVRALPETAGEASSFRIEWSERGGPRVAPPAKKGFGNTVITRSLEYSPHGGAEIDFAPDGVRCLIRIPLEDVHP